MKLYTLVSIKNIGKFCLRELIILFYSCIAVATKVGFKIFSSNPFQLLYSIDCGPINIVEMLNSTNLVLLVSLTEFGDFSPKKITVWSTTQNCVLCSSFPFTANIEIAKLNSVRMIIKERHFMHIYSSKNLKVLQSLDIGDVSLGKLVLSANTEKNIWVCCSSSKDEGIVKVYDTLYPSLKAEIKAHKSPILKMSMNKEGNRLATCSCKGTIIRIFSLPKGDKLCTFKRGIEPALIFCMNFSMNSEKLISSSDNGMVHVFDIKEEMELIENNKETKGKMKVIGRFLSTLASKFVPSDYEDTFGTSGASLYYKADSLKLSNLVAFSNENMNEAFCFTSAGNYYLFNIDYNSKKFDKSYERNMRELIKIKDIN